MTPFTLVIFGITSNLAQKYLLPALYDLEEKGLLPNQANIIGVARSPQEEGWIQSHLHQVLHKENLHHKHRIKDHIKYALFKKLHYLDGYLDDPKFYPRLKKRVGEFDSDHLIFYLATYPELYPLIFKNLHFSKLNRSAKGWIRMMIEKPFGTDFKSAQFLNKTLHRYFKESEIYRLDHYLGKEALRKILTFRFTDSQLEPLINNHHLDHIQVSATESFGIGERGAFYDRVGALKDVGQNHLLQMLTAATMDQPSEFINEEVTKERVKILNSLTPLKDQIIFGQYQGYTQEKHVAFGSLTETFFALKTYIQTDRFQGVPIYIRAGKKLAQTLTEVVMIFKDPGVKPLRYQIQPHQERELSQDPYEALILDAIKGDQTFFNSAEEVETQWTFIDPFCVKASKGKPLIYQPGSWGPREAAELIEKDGREWINS